MRCPSDRKIKRDLVEKPGISCEYRAIVSSRIIIQIIFAGVHTRDTTNCSLLDKIYARHFFDANEEEKEDEEEKETQMGTSATRDL